MKRPMPDAEQMAKDLAIAEAIVQMEQSPGWAAFKGLALDLVANYIPDVDGFKDNEAAFYASRLCFITGIRRCLGLVDQQKEILKAIKNKGKINA